MRTRVSNEEEHVKALYTKDIIGVIGVMIVALTLQACGTIIHGTSQDVMIQTNPPGALAKIGNYECMTPCALNVPRKSTVMAITKNNVGQVYPLDREVNWVTSVILGIWPGYFIGMGIDFANGSAYTIKPVNISLAASENADASGMKFPKEPPYKTPQEIALPAIAENKLRQTPINRGDSFAVLPFVVLSSDTRYSQLGQGFAENLTYYLVNSQSVKVIERTQMDKAIQEMRLGMTGIVDNSTAQAIGKVLGAKYVVIGSVEILGDHVEINCRVLQVQSSVNILVEKVSGTVDDLFALRNDLGQRISVQVAMSAAK